MASSRFDAPVRVFSNAGVPLKVTSWNSDALSGEHRIYVELPEPDAPPPGSISLQPPDDLPKRLEEMLLVQRNWVMALGLVSTLHPTMQIDTTDPIGMARAIVDHVLKGE